MPLAKKQSDRRAAKKAEQKQEDTEVSSGGPSPGGKTLELAKSLVMDSVLLKLGMKLKVALVDGKSEPGLGEKVDKVETDNEKEKEETEEKTDGNGDGDAAPTKDENGKASSTMMGLFETLQARLTWCNPLGLGQPATGELAKKAWLEMKGLEVDFGPPKKKRGNPGLDRVMSNFIMFMPQYIHAFFVLMLLRAVLFRSFFSFLPWLLALQIASLLVSLELLPQVELKFRVAGTMGIHALMWLFFLYEAVFRSYIFEKLFYLGILAGHAYCVRPGEF